MDSRRRAARGHPACVHEVPSLRCNGFLENLLDFYYGVGLVICGYLLVQAVVLWQLASRAKADPVGVRPIIASFFVSFLVNSILVWKYFFTVPLVMAIAIAISLGIALVSAGPKKTD
jgi:hypothetical protein